MTSALENVTKKGPEPSAGQRAEELVRRARKEGLSLTGPDGLLKQMSKTVIETALDQELAGHLGTGSTPRRVTRPGTCATGAGRSGC
jgi:putative transposase